MQNHVLGYHSDSRETHDGSLKYILYFLINCLNEAYSIQTNITIIDESRRDGMTGIRVSVGFFFEFGLLIVVLGSGVMFSTLLSYVIKTWHLDWFL